MPIYFLSSLLADTSVVPLPQNGSNTISPTLDDAFIMRSYRKTGFWVGYPVRSLDVPTFATSSQIVCNFAPG